LSDGAFADAPVLTACRLPLVTLLFLYQLSAADAAPTDPVAAFQEYLRDKAQAAVDLAHALPAPPCVAAMQLAAPYLTLTGHLLVTLLTTIVAFQSGLARRFGNLFPLSKSAFFAYAYDAAGSSLWVLPEQVACVTAPPPRAP
jgi:hypothetical protein